MAGTTGIAVLAACGGEDEAAAPAAAKEAAPAAAAPAAAAALEGVEIEVRWNGLDPAGQAAAKDGIVAFKEESGIVIKADFSDWASSFQKITTGFAAGTAPDIWQAGGLWTPVLAANGGDVAIIHVMVVHRAGHNYTGRSRNAIINEYKTAEAIDAWGNRMAFAGLPLARDRRLLMPRVYRSSSLQPQ